MASDKTKASPAQAHQVNFQQRKDPEEPQTSNNKEMNPILSHLSQQMKIDPGEILHVLATSHSGTTKSGSRIDKKEVLVING